MLEDIAEGIIKFVFHVIIEIICFYTGEIVLFILTFGHKKPRWDYSADASLPKWILLTEISFWIGVLFWALVAILIIALI